MTRMSRTIRACATAGVAIVAFAGCGEKKESTGASAGSGSGSSTGTSKQSGNASKTVKIDETEFKLSPADAKVAKGGKVVVQAVNSGKTTHALEIESKDGEFKTGNIKPGETARLQVTLKPGTTYDMYCPVGNHKQQGMVGKITVGAGGSGGGDDKGGSSGSDSSGGGGGGY
jgi:uncharacterized cupredoxin-like copper-binding protein